MHLRVSRDCPPLPSPPRDTLYFYLDIKPFQLFLTLSIYLSLSFTHKSSLSLTYSLALSLSHALSPPLSLTHSLPISPSVGIISTGDGYAIASKGPLGIEGSYLWDLKDKIDRQWIEGYNNLPDKEEMMKLMKLSKKAGRPVKNNGTESLLNLCKNDPNISEEDKKSLLSLLEGAVENEKRQGAEVAEDGEGGDGEDEVSEVARSMGQDTIDMLSNASMRYSTVQYSTVPFTSVSLLLSLVPLVQCVCPPS